MKSSSTSLPVLPTERRRILAALAALGGVAAWPRLALAQGRGMTAVAGTPPAPPLRLPDADGKPVDLAAYRGKVVLVNFWATWCPPCRQELPSLSRLKKKLSGEAFEILSVNIGEDVDTVFDFAGNPAYPMLFDHDSKAMASWPVKGVPTTLLVDRQGRLAYRAVGGREFDDADVVGLIRQLLKA
ncbi:MAG: TlpA family protein disulfide reductase [Rhodocyclaceae bacterium]|jgi:thiol-disulfide isomerase/thioredoxin|nr:MAG: TlpA family protein disulfide reductase [Rhodocyclaceae bacterium]